MTRKVQVIPAMELVRTLQAAQDREAAKTSGTYPPYEWDLIVLVGKWMSTLLLIVALVMLISLYQSRQ